MRNRFTYCRWVSIAVFFILSLPYQSVAQNLEYELLKYSSLPRYAQISRFYQLNNYHYAWIGNLKGQQDLKNILGRAASFGLNEADYTSGLRDDQINAAYNNHPLDSLETDIKITDAAIHFFTELKTGNKTPAFRYTGLKYHPDVSDVVPLLLHHLDNNNLPGMVATIQPSSKEYKQALKKLEWMQAIVSAPDFKEVKITSTKVDESNNHLITKLYQLGIIDSFATPIKAANLKKYVKAAQVMMDLLSDGVLRSTSVEAFNVPIRTRIKEVASALNYIRWLEEIKTTGRVLILNQPSTTFFLYDKGKMLLDSKVIIGKTSTPTPTLTSTITELVLYPYWMVPNTIATRELLPNIKRNIGYLDAGGFQVVNRQGKVVNPYAINWHSLSSSNFPYVIRQSTGCDNALGIVKFNFYNPFSVYLHDTPTKSLFNFNRRFFSHGCMRVEKPIELARYLLGTNRIAIDTLTAKGCLKHKSPKTIKIERTVPVIVMYSTAWYNKEGELRFYEDAYGKLR